MLTQRDYDVEELASLERRLSDVTDPGRQTGTTEAGEALRASLRADIARLRERLASEDA